MNVVHSGHGGTGDATRVKQDANDGANVELSFGGDKCHYLHDGRLS